MFCKYCGKELKDDVVFCSRCGKRLKQIEDDSIKKTTESVQVINENEKSEQVEREQVETEAVMSQTANDVPKESEQIVSEIEKPEPEKVSQEEVIPIANENANSEEQKEQTQLQLEPEQAETQNNLTVKKFCEQCGTELVKDAKFCLNCGSSVDGKPLISTTSNKPTAPSFVTKPSDNTTKYVPTESDKSRTIAALLAFFLGGFGAHRFYVGKTNSAFVQLVLGFSFFIALICFYFYYEGAGIFFIIMGIAWPIWILVDLIMILSGSFKDKDNLILTNWDF